MADEQIVTSIVAKADLSSLVSEVHRATASLQQLQRELLTSNKSIAAATKVSNNLFSDSLVKSGLFSSHFVNLTSDVDKFGKGLDAGRLKLKDFASTFQAHAKTSGGLIRELAKEQVMLQNAVLQPLGRNAQGLMQFNVAIPRGLDLVKNKAALARMEMQIMNRTLSEGSTALVNWGKNTQWAGRQLTVGLTVPLTMFGVSAAKAFREADAELVRLTKVYGDLSGVSSQELSKVRKDVIGTSKELTKAYGVNFKDTISLAADIAATGKTGNDLLGSVKQTTRLAVLGEIDRQDAMKATLSLQTAFKMNTDELSKSIDFLNAVENQTSTTLQDLVDAIPKAGPVIKGLGGDVKDLALYLTAMREGGINATEGANALKSGLASLINPTKVATDKFKGFGIDLMGIVQTNAGNVTATLLSLQTALEKLNPLQKQQALEQLFGKFQFARMNALFSNLGKQGSQTLKVMDLMKASSQDLANVAGRELAQVTESASGKYKRAIEGLKADMAQVGEQFLKIGTIIAQVIDKVINFFSMLPKPLKQALTFLGGLVAVAGPLIMLTGVLANFFGYIIKGIVHLRAFFKGAASWKMLTPEIIAAQKAANLVEKSFYSDAAAAQVLDAALKKLITDYADLNAQMMKGAVPINPGVSTSAGSTIMSGGARRQVDPSNKFVGEQNTRAMAHILPRDSSRPATLMGVVPASIPVNRAIQRAPQVYMDQRLPNVEGLTSVKGISTGIVSGEAARFHALMATLGMQTKAEVESLKKTIALGGTVSSELLGTFDDILPITEKFTQQAATGSAAIVAEMKAGKLTVDQAKAKIMALNAEIETMMGSALTSFAGSRGKILSLDKAPLMNQPVVDANGQFTLRDLYKKQANRAVMEEFGRLRGIKTFGAPYSIETTRLPRFNDGGGIESFGANKTKVSGSTSINYDDRLGNVPVGGYVLNQKASLDPANAALVAMAPQTYLTNGGEITANLTPGETVFGPKIQKNPELYAAVNAANNGYNFGGQIKKGLRSYGKQNPIVNVSNMRETPAYYRKVLGQYIKFINDPRYDQNIRMRMIMLDAAEYSQYMSPKSALDLAISNFDSAKSASGKSQEKFIAARIAQVKELEKKFPGAAHPSGNTRVANSYGLNKNLNSTRAMMLRDPRFANVADLIEQIPKTWGRTSAGVPFLSSKELQYGNVRGHLLRNGNLPYATRGFAGVAAVLPYEINSFLNRMDQIKLMPDILHLNQTDAKSSLMGMINKAGMSKMTSLDDIALALSDTHKFKSAKDLASNPNAPRATAIQRQHLKMLLTAVSERKKWVMRGRPPVPMLANFNRGGGIMTKFATGGVIGNVLKGLAMRRIGAGFGPTGAPKPSMYESAPWGVNSLSIKSAETLFAGTGLRKNSQKLLYDKFAAALAKEMPYGYVKAPNGDLKKALEPAALDYIIRTAASDLMSDRKAYMQLSPIDKDILKKKYLNWESKKDTPITAELKNKIFGNTTPGFSAGGVIRRGKNAYGVKGNPAARAEQQRIKLERSALHAGSSASSYTASGNAQMQINRIPYVGGTGVAGNAYNASFTPSAYKTINTLRMAQFPHMNMPTMPMNIAGVGNTAAITQAFKDLSMSITRGATAFKYGVATSGTHITAAYSDAGKAIANGARSLEMQAKLGRSLLRNEAYQQHSAAGTMDKYRPNMVTGPIGLTPWQSAHVEGVGTVSSRKSGYLGFRKTQFQVDGEAITRQQAVQKGLVSPRGTMGQGGQMGMMMGGQMAGMAIMQKNQGLGMGVMIGSSILPMLGPKIASGASAVSNGVKGAYAAFKAGSSVAKVFVNVLTKMKFAGPIGAIITLGDAVWRLKKHLDQVHQNTQLTFGMTQKGAEQAGIKYFNLAETMKLVAERQKAMFASAKGAYKGSSVPGLTLSVTELKKEKENAKKNLGEFVDTFSTVGKDNIVQTATNIKAQFLAAGMSVEEANKKIYASIAVSKNASSAFTVLSDSGFMGITDKATAAKYSVESFAKVLDGSIKGSGFDDLKTATIEGISSVVNAFTQYKSSLIGTKDELGKTITSADAFKISMEKLASVPGFSKAMGDTAFANLPTQFQAISNSADSIAGILAKWELYSSDIVVNFKEISSEAAVGLAAFNSAFGTAMTNLETAAGPSTTFSTMGKTLTGLKKIITANSQAAQRAAAQSQRNAEDEIKVINKKIKLIQDEADAKLKAMQTIQAAESYQLNSQQAQLEYQDAIAKGDMAAAAAAQLKQTQLTKDYQMQLAQEAIRDEAAKKAEAQQKKAEAVQASIDAAARAAQIAAEKSADATNASDKITGFKGRYENLLQQKNDIQFLDPSKQAAATEQSNKNLSALIAEIQKSGTGNTLVAKSIKEAFSAFFDKNGKPIAIKTGVPLPGATEVLNPQIAGTIASDIAAANKQADSIVKGIAGGMTIAQLAVAMGYKVPGAKATPGLSVTESIDSRNNKSYEVDIRQFQAAGITPKVGNTFTDKNGKTWKIMQPPTGDRDTTFGVVKAGYGMDKINPMIPTIVGDMGPELLFGNMVIPSMANIPYASPRYDINKAQKIFDPMSQSSGKHEVTIINNINAAEGMDIEALSSQITMKTVKIIKDMDKNYNSQVGQGRTN